jgi:hypothetical protein
VKTNLPSFFALIFCPHFLHMRHRKDTFLDGQRYHWPFTPFSQLANMNSALLQWVVVVVAAVWSTTTQTTIAGGFTSAFVISTTKVTTVAYRGHGTAATTTAFSYRGCSCTGFTRRGATTTTTPGSTTTDSSSSSSKEFALLFDCDGVILETEEYHRLAYNEAFRKFQLTIHNEPVEWSVRTEYVCRQYMCMCLLTHDS